MRMKKFTLIIVAALLAATASLAQTGNRQYRYSEGLNHKQLNQSLQGGKKTSVLKAQRRVGDISFDETPA